MGCVGVQARGGLVQEDEPGIAQQRYANVTALGLSACIGTTSLSGHTYIDMHKQPPSHPA